MPTATTINGFNVRIYHPGDKQPGPAVVLCTDAEGIDKFMLETASLYGEEGYLTVLPDLSGVSDPLEALTGIIAATRAMPECTAQVGILGFGVGAELGWRATQRVQLDAFVGYGGSQFDTATLPLCPVTLELPGGDAASAVRAALSGKPQIEVHVYEGASQGFERPASPSYFKALAELAHDRAIGRFRRAMGPYYDLGALWEYHRDCEFTIRDAAKTMETMVASPYVNHIPTMTGGVGFKDLARFYKYHFIPKNSTERSGVLVSRTIGATQIVEEILTRFVHDREIDWMLPGIKPTGKRVEVALVVVVKFRGPKLYHEHIYWDQASVLAQLGLIDSKGLPIAGADGARKLIDESLPSNTLLPNWHESAGKPIP